MGRRFWRRILRIGAFVLLGVLLGEATDVLAAGWSIGIGLALAAITELLLALLERRAAASAFLSDDPPPAPAPDLPDWLIDRPREAEQIITAVLARRSGAVGITTGLHGAGGFGKTTLAHIVANDRRVRRRFRNRIYLTTVGQDVRGREAVANLVNETVHLITGTRVAFTDPRRAGDHLAQVLHERPRILLVIDDVWDREQLDPFLRGGERCTRLVTTRIRDLLPTGARLILVDTMSPEQSRALLTWGLASGISAQLIEDLLRVTGGWALLLRLVNRSIDARTVLGAGTDEAARTVFELITADPAALDPRARLDVADPGERSRAVSATIGGSTALLAPTDLPRLHDLGVFAEDQTVPIDLVARLWRATGKLGLDESRRLCDELRRLALVLITDNGAPGLQLHDAIRAHLRAELGPRRQDVHAALVEAVAADLPAATTLDQSASALNAAWWRLDENEHYLYNHLVEHLGHARLDAQRDALVTDLRWIGQRLRLHGPAALAADLAHAHTDCARNLAVLVGQNAHLLAPTDPPESVIDILLSRLRDDPQWTRTVDSGTAVGHRPRLHPVWPLPDRSHPSLERVLAGHEWATSVSWSPDTTRLATASYDGTVRISDPTTTATLGVLSRDASPVFAVAWSPQGTRIATADNDGQVRIWDQTTATVISVLVGHAGPVFALGWSPDGSRLASAGADCTVRIWDTATATALSTLAGHTDWIRAVAWSPDGTRLASAAIDRTVRIWDSALATAVATFNAFDPKVELIGYGDNINWVTSVAWSPDGTRLASTGSDAAARIWDPSRARVLATLIDETSIVRVATWSPDGGTLVTANSEGTLRIWDPASATAIATLTGHTHFANAVAWSPDGTRIATASTDGTVRIWDPSTSAAAVTKALPEHYYSLQWSPDGTRLAATGRSIVDIWDVAAGTTVATVREHTGSVWSLAWSPDGNRIATVGVDRTVRIWDTATATSSIIESVDDRRAASREVAWSPDGTRLAMARFNGEATIADPVTGTAFAVLDSRANWVGGIAWSPDGGHVAAAGADGVVTIWEWAASRPLAMLAGHTGPVRAVVWSPDGSRIATTSDDGTSRIWDVATARTTSVIAGTVESLAWSPDGVNLAAVSRDAEARVFDAASGEPVAMLRVDAPLNSCGWSPDGRHLALCGWRGVYLLAYLAP